MQQGTDDTLLHYFLRRTVEFSFGGQIFCPNAKMPAQVDYRDVVRAMTVHNIKDVKIALEVGQAAILIWKWRSAWSATERRPASSLAVSAGLVY